jgi:hypothetical protein
MTKDLVDKLRCQNQHNRKLKEVHIEALKHEILAGKFLITNQGIGISRNNMIIDGGHRLEALARAGYPPIKMLIVENLSAEAQLCVDTHTKRTMPDILTLARGTPVPRAIVSMLNIWWKAQPPAWKKKPYSAGPHDNMELLSKLDEQIAWLKSIDGMLKLSAPVLAAFVTAYPGAGIKNLTEFAEAVISGEIIEKGMAAYALREYLTKSAKLHGGVQNQRDRYEKTLYAIEAHINNERVDKLSRKEKWDFIPDEHEPSIAEPAIA